MILAVLFSSLKKLKENSFCKQTADQSNQFHENFREIDFTEILFISISPWHTIIFIQLKHNFFSPITCYSNSIIQPWS